MQVPSPTGPVVTVYDVRTRPAESDEAVTVLVVHACVSPAKAPLDRPWAELVRELKRLHSEVLAILAKVPDGFTSEARAPAVLVINAKNPDGSGSPVEWVEDLDWKAYSVIFRLHEVDHLNQAKRALGVPRREA